MTTDDVRNRREARLQGLNQDILAVSQTQPVAAVSAPGHGNNTAPTERAQQRSNSNKLPLLAALLIALVALLMAGYALWIAHQQQAAVAEAVATATSFQQRLARQELQGAQLAEQLAAAQQQLETLQLAPAPAGANGGSVGSAQVNARLRKNEIELEQLAAQFAQARDALGQYQQFRQQTLQQLAQQNDRLSGVSQQVTDTRQLLAGQDQQAALRDMETRLERATTDIRSLYRMLELGR